MKTIRKERGRPLQAAPVLAVLLVLFHSVFVSAEKTEAFLQSYRTEEGRVFVYCSSFSDIDAAYEQGEFSVKAGNQEIPVLDVSTVGEEGVTYYCLVDVSGSMHDEQFAQAKSVLNTLCDGLGENDNMAVGALGTELTPTDFLDDKEEIHEAIDGLTADDDYTALYDAVQASLSVLENSNKCRQKKCLIIISDGEDDTVIGTTREEAQNAVRDSRIPVYTVAALREGYTDEQISHAEGLGVFARISAGGKDYVPLVEGTDASEAGAAILEDTRSGVILTLDTSGLSAERDEMLLLVQFKNDTITSSDSMYLYTPSLLYAPDTEAVTEEVTEKETDTEKETEEETEKEKETEKETEEKTEGETKESETDTEHSGEDLPSWLPLLLAVLAVLALAAAVLLIVKSRAKKTKQPEDDGSAENGGFERIIVKEIKPGGINQETAPADSYSRTKPTNGNGSESVPETVPAPAGRKYHVKFAAIGYRDIAFDMSLPEEQNVTIGRNKKADYILNPDDKYLSSVQCKVRCVQGVMNIWDLDSQNGTFVNGVPIRQIGMATVQTGDSVRMGGYEYRVVITAEEGNSDGS